MKLIGICRLGRDAETRYTPSGEAVCGFSAAFDYGRKGDDGRRPTQWIEMSLWGKRAEALAEYLTKGRQVYVIAGEPHVEVYEKRDGSSGVKLVARVDDLQLVGGRDDGEQRQAAPSPARAAAPAPRAAKSSGGGTGFDDDFDVPF